MPNAEDAARIVASQATVSDKIRALNAAGYPRAEIARLLGKRYQHVRNVLEGDKVGRAASATNGVAEEPAVFERDDERPGRRPSSAPPRPEFVDRGRGIFRLSIRPDGSVLLPPSVLEALELKGGSGVIARLDGDTLILDGAKETLRKIRELIPPWQPGEPLASDELIAERRREAVWEELPFEEARTQRAAYEATRMNRASEDG
ncbi:MAG: AbrB/MazE/SpoVT family DNA-binding domain-containing protein [Caulobacter sp.]|nr:AbrB/MazE/SpoVT family DNA-binding domain-containing protein [Caulobacter sp.]